ncbi:MAG: hypothetical protein GXO07_05745 [Crenarchaeota archaeon]|nr:hypothetical protein [Thermoproteota archaeon]
MNEMAPVKISGFDGLEPSKLSKEQHANFPKKSAELGERSEVIMRFVQGRMGELKV